MTHFTAFQARARSLHPRTAVVLGSGLAGVVDKFEPQFSLSYGDVPGLVPPTVAGHPGRLELGTWHERPVLVCLGRLHLYEGHGVTQVTRLVHIVADLGIRTLILTCSAGGLRDDLDPGSIMPIRDHMKWIGPNAWRESGPGPSPYSARLLSELARLDRTLVAGTYAALTGPCYETPAEVRALRAVGADAVGMSTALEAEAGARRGLEVAALACITNRAAGLTGTSLSHEEVVTNARLATGHLKELVGGLAVLDD